MCPESSAPSAEQTALHAPLQRVFGDIRKGVIRCDWELVEDSFCTFCERHNDFIPPWFVDEYVFQAMRLWGDGAVDEVLRHFAKFINRAAGVQLVDGIAERARLHEALISPYEKTS